MQYVNLDAAVPGFTPSWHLLFPHTHSVYFLYRSHFPTLS